MLKTLLLVLGTLLPCTVAIISWAFTGFHARHESFEDSRWVALREHADMYDPGCIRGGMALDLVRSEILIGLPKDALQATLVVPSFSQPDMASYALGQCSWDWRDSELAVHLDESGNVKRAEIRDTPYLVFAPHPGNSPSRDTLQEDSH